MSFCLTELYLWSLKNSLHVGEEDLGVYQYHEKKESAQFPDYGYAEEKQQFVESRGFPWILKNKRPEKLRDNLTELEELMQSTECVLSKWKNKYVCQLLFGSGVLVSLSLSGPQLEKVVIDRTLVGKLISNPISDAVFTDGFIILSFVKESKLCLIQFTKKTGSPDINKHLEKLSSQDLKISYIDLPGPLGRHLNRHLALNCMQDLAICWWPVPVDDIWPWSPVSSDKDRANLVLLGCTANRLEILSYIRTERDLLDASFSIHQPYHVHTLEHAINSDKEPMADSCIYECVRHKIQCLSVTRIPLRSKVISCSRNISEDQLVLGCEDSSLILYDAHRRVTLLAQAEILPVLIRWHPSGSIFVVSSNQGELQIFDMALSPLKIQLVSEDTAPKSTLQCYKQFNVSTSLVEMQWTVPFSSLQCVDTVDIHKLLYLRFYGGPLGVLQFKLGAISRGQLGPLEIISQYLRFDELDEAIGVLSCMNWDTKAHQCYTCMSAIANHLLRQKLTPEREAQLEACLGTFYSPEKPLLDTTIVEYRDPISRYARRFFHHLLRYQRFEKAFLLAIDIGTRDLFMDIHYLALDKGELALAKVAKKKAEEIDAESISAGVDMLDRLDDVNEGFADLSLMPQEQRFSEGFPAIDSDTERSQLKRATSRQLVHIENEIGIEDFAESLDKTLPWNQGMNRKVDVKCFE
ncbi:WD repeat-containing and planar cell polarity effector protein fritz homolog [Pelobates fuscus]|uniref:WD repeat-containing and planar cell polarity effector protein fritz homolog n=1 Tax=Pelobates fuscus TaxID=191477 RepID=UPI002FE4DF7E